MKFKFVEKIIPPVTNQNLAKEKDKTKLSTVNTPVLQGKNNVLTPDSSGISKQTVNNKTLSPNNTTKQVIPISTTTKTKEIKLDETKLKPKTVPLNFEFEVSPEQIDWSKTGELEVSPTFMTNEQPVIYSRASMPIMSLNGILFDSIHVSNKSDLMPEISGLERLLSVDEANFSPRVYDLFAESRKYGTYVFKSLKINESRRDIKGKSTRVLVDMELQPVPSYQLRTSQDLAMIAEILPEIKVSAGTEASSGDNNKSSAGTAGGCEVPIGTEIGKVGQSGSPNNIHIHLEKRVSGTIVNPKTSADDFFKVNGKPLSSYVGSSSGQQLNADRDGGKRKHQGVDYAGMAEGSPITIATSGISLTYVGHQIGASGRGWGNYFKCVNQSGIEMLVAHCQSINKSLFKCDAPSKKSSNSGNKGGNVDPDTNKTTGKTNAPPID